jgi:hypothetical protein
MSYGEDFVLTLFTNDPDLAREADRAGIDRIGPDLEWIGKLERQEKCNSWISDHKEKDIIPVRDKLARAKLFVRTNPIHPSIKEEIDRYLDCGAQVLMFPMFESAREVTRFIDSVAGRAEVSLLMETPAAAFCVHEIVRIPGIDEIHIGLNDMRLATGLSSHFDVLASDLMDRLSDVIRGAGISFGFGGVGRLNDSRLPVPSDLVYAQYPLLSGDRALVSRVFITADKDEIDLPEEVKIFRERMDYWKGCGREKLSQAREELRRVVVGLRS